jgi:hypothetical protein
MTGFRKSSFSGAGNCVEVKRTETEVWLRDSKLGDDSPVLKFSLEEFEAFEEGIRAGEFRFV